MKRQDKKLVLNAERKYFQHQNSGSRQAACLYRRLSLVLLICMVCLLPKNSQAQSQPVGTSQPFIEGLEIEFAPKVPFPMRTFQNQYLNRIYQPQLLLQIDQAIIANLKNNGYYFARLDSHVVKLNSVRNAVTLQLSYKTGQQMRLNQVVITNLDSLPGNIQSMLTDRLEFYQGDIYTESLLNNLLETVISIFENNGFPLARAETEDFLFNPSEEGANAPWLLDLSLSITPGDSVQLAYLRFPKQKSNLTPYLQRLLRFRTGTHYDERRIAKYIQVMRRQEFIKDVQAPRLSKDKNGDYFLDIEFEETPATALDGIVGYIPPPANDPDASGYFTGLVNIGIRNLFGGGRKMHIFWQKQDEFSDEFKVFYREPFMLGLPFHSQIGMNRLVRDTTFIEWQYDLNFELPLSDALSAFVAFSSRNVVPDSLASRRIRLPQTESFTTETGLRWDVRDQIQNPRSGALLEVAFALSSQKNTGPQYLIEEDSLRPSVTLQRMRADFSLFIPTFRRQLLSNHFHMEFIENRGDVLRSPDQVWFGGATTVRGFREAQFFARRVFWLNSEYRFILGPQARFFFFTDNALFNREFPEVLEDWLTSYGLGLRFAGPLGVVQIDYGLESGAPFREGKLHFRIINEF